MKFYTVDQAAELLQCSDHTVRQMISAGKLYAIRLGATDRGDIRIGEAALLEFGVGAPVAMNISRDVISDTLTRIDWDSVIARSYGDLTKKAKASAKRSQKFDTSYRRLAAEVFKRDSYTCVYCGSFENLTLDHVIPQSKGGTHDIDNLVACCRSCNSSKGDRNVDVWKSARRLN